MRKRNGNAAGQVCKPPRKDHFRLSIGSIAHLNIAVQEPRLANGFPHSFFGRKANGKVLRRILPRPAINDFLGRKDPFQKTKVVNLLGNAMDFHDINADIHSIYSTVTDLARLRGWSTSQPRRTAM